MNLHRRTAFSLRTELLGRFLLSGTLRCSECGANFVMINRTSYGCAGRTNGGLSCCANDGKFRRDAAESALLAGIRTELAQPGVISEVGRRVRARLRLLAAPRTNNSGRVSELQADIARLVDAIAQIGLSEGLAAHLRKAEAELTELQQAAKAPRTASIDRLLPDIEARYLRMLEQLPTTLMSVDPIKARAELAEKIGRVSVVTTPAAIEFYSEKGRMEAAFLRAVGVELPTANMNGSGGRI
jgi:site-specific DNA recombinase